LRRIKVKVIARASRNAIEEVRAGEYRVWVTAVPEKGLANLAVAKLLALEFGVPVGQVRLRSGQSGRQKRYEIG